MLMSSHSSSIEAALSVTSDHGKQEFLCDWIPGTESWQNCPKCDIHPEGACRKADKSAQEKIIDRSSSSSIRDSNISELFAAGTVPKSLEFNFVYRRRKVQKNSVAICSAQTSKNIKSSDHCLSAISSDVSLMASRNAQQGSLVGPEIEAVRSPIMPTAECSMDPLISKSESIDGCSGGELHEFDPPKDTMCKNSEFSSVNDSCSSSKSNMEHGSTYSKGEVDDTGECSSSGVSSIEDPREALTEKEFCISFLESEGLLGTFGSTGADVSSEDVDISGYNNCSRSCKVCGHLDFTCNMLICDHCEEAYHVSCCPQRIRKIPLDEWLCHCCWKKRHKLLRERTTRKPLDKGSKLELCKIATCRGELSPVEFMLKDVQPYITGVRIGKEFQADVPDWSGPIESEDADCVGEPMVMGPSECACLHHQDPRKPSRLSSIGNWLQCREVIEGMGEGVDGTVCGKWRRAPLFEVQTDNWNCFNCVLWDPAHADCAVPQELETDQVLKQLKYIEMLRPRLAAKRRKQDCNKSNDLQCPAEDD